MICFIHPLNSQLENLVRHEITDDVVVFPPKDELEESFHIVRDATIVVGSGDNLKETLIKNMVHLKWVHSVSAGVDTFPLEILNERGILLSNSRGIHIKPISEQILGVMISFSRSLHRTWVSQGAHRWDPGQRKDELFQKTLLVVGAGSIGQELARRAQAFDMKVVGVKAHPVPHPHFNEMVSLDSLDDYLPQADYVVLLLPLTKLTYHVMDARRIGLMKETGILLNYGRGPVLDQMALVEALKEHRIGGAGLDVFEEEPLPPDDPLWKFDNVLITPHTGGWTPYHDERLVEIFLSNWRAYHAFGTLTTPVDIGAGY